MGKKKTFRRVNVAGCGYTLGKRKQIFGGKAIPSKSQPVVNLEKKTALSATNTQSGGVEQNLTETDSTSNNTREKEDLQAWE